MKFLVRLQSSPVQILNLLWVWSRAGQYSDIYCDKLLQYVSVCSSECVVILSDLKEQFCCFITSRLPLVLLIDNHLSIKKSFVFIVFNEFFKKCAHAFSVCLCFCTFNLVRKKILWHIKCCKIYGYYIFCHIAHPLVRSD